jgi:tetratricopeptide (TPR) repeat protein
MRRISGLIAVSVCLFGLIASAARAQSASSGTENPEALMNQARVSADRGELDRAISTYERALEIVTGPRRARLDGATAVQWRAFEPLARLNLGLLIAAKGIDLFQADNLEGAIASFRSSLQWNPYSRDVLNNLTQALYIQASRLKDQGRSPEELAPLYRDILVQAARVRELDPANPNLLLLMGYTHRNLGEELPATERFVENAGLPFEVHDIRMAIGSADTLVSGVLKNLKLMEGDPVKLRITLVALDGTATGTTDVQVTAPAANQGTSFGATINTIKDVAGWRYEIVK